MTNKLTALIVLLVIPAAMAADEPHCVTGENGFSITTSQCDDGTVVVTTGRKLVVCRKDHDCTEIKL